MYGFADAFKLSYPVPSGAAKGFFYYAYPGIGQAGRAHRARGARSARRTLRLLRRRGGFSGGGGASW